jgi:CRP/FNR family cyclic AMP-dependent transcriptional regulator
LTAEVSAVPTPYNLEIRQRCTECHEGAARAFCDLPPSAMTMLEEITYAGVYPKGSLLFVEGEKPRGVFILCSGRVKLTESSADGRTLIVKSCEPGEILGISSTILGNPYDVAAETLEPSQANFIKREEFLRFLSLHAEACVHTAQQLSEKYQAAQHEIRSLGLAQSTSEKLARLLLDWSEHGEENGGGIRLKVLLTHGEIAQMLGTTRETVTRLLAQFKKKSLIDVRGSTVLVTNREGLQTLVRI